MKNKIIAIVGLSSFLVASCGNDYEIEDYFNLQHLPAYVAFKTDGQDAVMAPIETAEDGGSVAVAVENPTGSASDITVNYSLSGSAEWGVDYTIEGASATGGSILISPADKDISQFNFANINLQILADSTADGEKKVMITLEDAQNDDGSLAVGRGGTDFLKTAEVVIADIDGEE